MNTLDDYDYDLPQELIAQYPPEIRGTSRLLVVNRKSGEIHDSRISDFPDFLNTSDSIVLNDTRVIPARLRGTRIKTGGKWEGLFLEVVAGGLWKILSKTRGKIQPGETVQLTDRWNVEQFQLEFVEKLEGGMWLSRPPLNTSFVELLEQAGQVPLPPYIRNGIMTAEDLESYQTVYAEQPGAVAAPTAGLHFTDSLLDEIANKGVGVEKVTLHVGIGTFRPIEVSDIATHQMHREWGRIGAEQASRLLAAKQAGGRVISIGTTSVRVLETAAAGGQIEPWQGDTDLFIKPGYEFKAVDGLLTNFHLPKSSLLVLIRTFGGDALMREAYAKAIELRYRFYSYGDAMLII